ncbi:hypothetical protein TREES_T100011034 [Tupaia chinensis]|uniref:Uncharacterized protein n=1 Tax=Tupaia chinensis TaxID=246437 RepID=L9JCQ5_TUPCH|nr:hypothetical protein TREES_T100011034 [Tupaia chinensis]
MGPKRGDTGRDVSLGGPERAAFLMLCPQDTRECRSRLKTSGALAEWSTMEEEHGREIRVGRHLGLVEDGALWRRLRKDQGGRRIPRKGSWDAEAGECQEPWSNAEASWTDWKDSSTEVTGDHLRRKGDRKGS